MVYRVLPLLLLSPVALCHAQAFRHPGILQDAAHLADTSRAIAFGDPDKVQMLKTLQSSPTGSLSYQARPWATVECGPYSTPNRGCSDEINDATAAYAHALLSSYTSDARHARKAMDIMDAWATTLKGGHTHGNAALQAATSAQLWTRAAELIRYQTNTPWSSANATRFGQWLLTQYLPDINKVLPCQVTNWQASAIEARANIGIYTDRRDIYNQAVADWRARLPAAIYVSSDGTRPVQPPGCTTPIANYWSGQTQMMHGLSQQTCANLDNVASGLASLINVAETDRIQGGNLYSQGAERLRAGMEFHADMAARASVPGTLCKGNLTGGMLGSFEIGYAHYYGRMLTPMPHTRTWLRAQRPHQGHGHYKWETLTHGIPVSPATNGFRHPGILQDTAQLTATTLAIAQGNPDKVRALTVLKSKPAASLDYTPRPWQQVECGGYSIPNFGCTDETNDATAAYAHALLSIYTSDPRHARKSVEIMDAWATTLTGGHTNGNAGLQASWAAQLWTRAAELIRYQKDTPWSEANAERFGRWLLSQYIPDIDKVMVCQVANWQASSIEARVNIGIYTNRRDIYNKAIADWRARLPASIYINSDGARPVQPPSCNTPIADFWFGQTQMMHGLSQETCRDLDHTAYGLAALINVAETDRIQGGNLYSEGSERLRAAMEFHTDMASRSSVPGNLCKGKLIGGMSGTYEIGYGHYNGRMGQAMPHTRNWLRTRRPTEGYFHYKWETLTHGVPLGN